MFKLRKPDNSTAQPGRRVLGGAARESDFGSNEAGAPQELVQPVARDSANEGIEQAAPARNTASVISHPSAAMAASSTFAEIAGLRFASQEIGSAEDLSRVVFHEVVNKSIKLGAHMFARIAIAQKSAATKECLLFVDRKKITPDDLNAVVEMLKGAGYMLPREGVQGYFASSTLVLSLSQGHLDAGMLSAEREISRDKGKSALFSSFRDIISWAFENKANDIDFALDTTQDRSQVAFKINGRYVRPAQHLIPTDTMLQMLGIAWQKSAGGASSQFEVPSEQQAKLDIDLPPTRSTPDGARVRLRWSGMSNDKGSTVTMRLQRLGASADIRSLEDAGYLPSQMEKFNRVIHSEGGMVVFSGVVGSGKSTSLVSLIKRLPTHVKIQTMEDPVELDIPHAYQKTIVRDLASTGHDPAFASATRALYRSALDVLYLGEVRDPETGLVARQVVESGHSVYTTTHARSALGVFDRFASPAINVPRDVLATPDIIKLLVYQALLPTNCPHCSKTPDDYALAKELRGDALRQHQEYFDRIYRLYNIEPKSFRMHDEQGCSHCRRKDLPDLNGFSGRTVVSEMIEPDDTMLGYVLKGNNIELNRYWRSLATPDYQDPDLTGKNTMECAIYKASCGQIDPREIEPRFMSFETVEQRRQQANRAAFEMHSRGGL